MTPAKRWWVVFFYAVAMAWVEAAVVYYLRVLINRMVPYQPYPLPVFGGLGPAELVRELATLIMLATVGILAGTNRQSRFGYSLVAFGVWDIFYYLFLRILTDWPKTVLDWDILFLLPLPWWGPVLAPVLIALGMITLGSLLADDKPFRPRPSSLALAGAGAVAALYAFMEGTLTVSMIRGASLRHFLPEQFSWGLFLVALAAMYAPVIDLLWQRFLQHRRSPVSLNTSSPVSL